jgi:filamentous hemagglutinin family protein
MRTYFSWATAVFCFTAASVSLLALPQNPTVASGDVSIETQSQGMSIRASDRSIINYTSFDVQKGEKVQFIQPSASSCVLNRVQGGDPSKILGQMESNGKVLLINPNGMYFGPDASVKTASFIASTLDIANEDFLKGRYFFSLQNKQKLTEIRNEGLLEVSPEGCVVLMASKIHNSGTIQAPSGDVVLAAGEQVTLDFQGDRLLQFSVEGDVKGAVLEHLGSIQAEAGTVSMRLPTAKKAIRDIVNHDGMQKGEMFVSQNGEIFLVSGSSVVAKNVDVEGSSLSVEGKIDASNRQSQGGSIHLSGAEISLRGAHLDASGVSGGGEVLIGGDVQGLGSIPHALLVSMDHDSQILANATEKGDGGRVVLWSRQKTEFEGRISAKGGLFQGNGGFVETSGLEALFSMQGHVNTSAVHGTMGQWLLDPITTLNIVPGAAAGDLNCVGGSVGVGSFTNSPSDVNICATIINVQVDSITMTQPQAGLLFTTPPESAGTLHLQGAGGSAIAISTMQGKVVVTNMNTLLDKDTVIDTTAGGTYPIGAGIVLQDVNANGSGIGLGLNAGNSLINLGDLGLLSPLHNVTINASSIYVQDVITQGGGNIRFLGPAILEMDSVFDTSNGGGNIVVESVDSIRSGYASLSIKAGSGSIFMQGVGVNTPLGDFLILSAAEGVITGDIITQNGMVQIVPSMQLGKPKTIIKTFSDLNTLLSAPIVLGDVIPSIPHLESLSLLTGLKGSITIGNVGSEDLFLKNLIVETNQPFVIQDVYASNLGIDALSGSVFLNGSVNLLGNLLVSDSNAILLGGPITADNISLQARSSILNQGSSDPITILNSGLTYLNAASGQIGTQNNPVLLETQGPVVVGGDPVFLAGEYPAVSYVPGNVPCLILVKGQEIACALAHKAIFQNLQKSSFARSFHFNIVNLGIEFPPNWYNNMQFSPFERINAVSGNLPPVSEVF